MLNREDFKEENTVVMRKNKLSKIPDQIKECDYIELLDLSFNQINKIELLQNLKCLQILDLSNNLIKKIEGLEKLVNLTELYLQNNDIAFISSLWNNNNLKIINFSHNKIKNLGDFLHNSSLQTLDLSFNSITNIENAIEYLPDSIIKLDLSSNNINNLLATRFLNFLPNLRELNFNNNPFILHYEKFNINYRPFLLFIFGNELKVLNSIEITKDETNESLRYKNKDHAEVREIVTTMIDDENNIENSQNLFEKLPIKSVDNARESNINSRLWEDINDRLMMVEEKLEKFDRNKTKIIPTKADILSKYIKLENIHISRYLINKKKVPLKERILIKIQSAVRGWLIRKRIYNYKEEIRKINKIQALFRGVLIRKKYPMFNKRKRNITCDGCKFLKEDIKLAYKENVLLKIRITEMEKIIKKHENALKYVLDNIKDKS